MGPDTDTYSVSFDLADPSCTKMTRFLLSQLDLNGNVTRISIEIESRKPFEIDLPAEEGVETESTDEPDPEPEPETESAQTAQTEHDVTTFQQSSNTWPIIKMLYERRDEGFLEIPEIRQFTPNEAGIPESQFSKVCWDLWNRGLLDKKDHDDDGRKNVYKITGKGVDAVEATLNSE